MATLIICPACDTHYEIAAVLPPQGRKVRCSKCGHTWQATGAAQEAASESAPPQPPPPEAPPVVPVSAAMRGFAGIAPTQPGAADFGAGAQAPAGEPAGAEGAFGSDYKQDEPGFETDYAPTDAAAETEAGFEAESESSFETEVERDVTFAAVESGAETGVAANAEAEDVNFEASSQAVVETDADFDTGGTFTAEDVSFSEEVEPAAGQPEGMPPLAAEAAEMPRDLSAMMTGKAGAGADSTPADVAMSAEPRKTSRAVAAGWMLLALLLLAVLGAMAVAPSAVVQTVPGAARVYAMLGMPVNLRGLDIRGVTYGWTGQGDLEIKGEVINLTDDSLKIPLIVIALRDENGEELSEWTTEVSQAPLVAGGQAQFWTEIPAPPDNVRSVKVRFAKAN